MFTKLYEKLDTINSNVTGHYGEFVKGVYDKVGYMKKENEYLTKQINGVIDSQQKTIEQLTKALCNKYEHGLFIFSEDGKIPMVIRNGKELTNNLTSSFGIEWSPGEVPNIQIEQVAATSYDMD
ncbi:hypothetical protein [Kineothrix sedimenti]|uniref:Uncharacterized protein n=1 Tax=Kineothrix sedimenti TaxID=3123317 RepID=A0ABZ3F1Z5_9FIRM